MKQTILALIRPKLNLSQPENQILHLIEHILMSPERQKEIGLDKKKFSKDIIFCGGFISELYCVEYYIIRSSALSSIKKIILSNRNNLCLDKINLKTMKKVIIQELEEEKNQEISTWEQFEKAIYQAKSPALRQPWFSTKELAKLNIDDENIDNIFKKYSQPSVLFELSFDQYNFSKKIKIDKNILNNSAKIIHLNHPYQATKTASVDILIPIKLDSNNFINFIVYKALLADYYFGILYKLMRDNGLVYDLSMSYNVYADAVQISFSCSKNKSGNAIDFIKKTMSRNQITSENYLKLIKEKTAINYELDWGDISKDTHYYLEEALLGEFYVPPKERIKRINNISTSEMNNFHKNIRNNLEKNSTIVVLSYGKKVSKK